MAVIGTQKGTMKQAGMHDRLEHWENGGAEACVSNSPNEQGATAAHLDAAVIEIFLLMLAMDCVPAQRPGGGEEGGRVFAAIRLSGVQQGRCVVEMPADAGDWLTDALMGSQADWDDEMIDDAVGELCNMVTGSLKRRLGPWPGECRISLPEVWRGSGEDVCGTESSGVWRFYRVSGRTLGVGLCGWGEM